VIACPVCGETFRACRGSAPAVVLTPEQRFDIGEITAKEYAAMTAQEDPQPRFPRQDVGDGQVHGYIGDVEVYDRETATGDALIKTTEAVAAVDGSVESAKPAPKAAPE
jgi:hypothetical protein